MQRKINPIVQWWVTPKLPPIHIEDKTNSVNKYFFHPIKRRLVKFYLSFLQNTTNIKVIGITGSAGKTTTKEMLAGILSSDGKTVFSKANIDPVYNIPSTILKTLPGTKYLVLEMGIEYPGEMDFYLWLAKPDVGIITNIFPTHTEFLGSIEGVFDEKKKLVYGLTKKGIAILNSDDKNLKSLSGKIDAKIFWFDGNQDPFIQNSNAAKKAALALGLGKEKIEEGLTKYKNPPHRLELIQSASGAKILDDSYNSNPWAAVSTLKYFNNIVENQKNARGKKMAILGDMLELGSFDEEGHRLLGREVAKSKFDLVVCVGKSSKFMVDEIKKLSKTKTILVESVQDAMPYFEKMLKPESFILVKGSRSIGLDKLISKLS